MGWCTDLSSDKIGEPFLILRQSVFSEPRMSRDGCLIPNLVDINQMKRKMGDKHKPPKQNTPKQPLQPPTPTHLTLPPTHTPMASFLTKVKHPVSANAFPLPSLFSFSDRGLELDVAVVNVPAVADDHIVLVLVPGEHLAVLAGQTLEGHGAQLVVVGPAPVAAGRHAAHHHHDE